jgi:predicted ArsR family transcriptional regulator
VTEAHEWVHRSHYGSDLTPRYFVPSVDTAARVLALLSRYSTKSLTLSEIMTSLEVSKATCLRVLKTLEMHGLLKFEARIGINTFPRPTSRTSARRRPPMVH